MDSDANVDKVKLKAGNSIAIKPKSKNDTPNNRGISIGSSISKNHNNKTIKNQNSNMMTITPSRPPPPSGSILNPEGGKELRLYDICDSFYLSKNKKRQKTKKKNESNETLLDNLIHSQSSTMNSNNTSNAATSATSAASNSNANIPSNNTNSLQVEIVDGKIVVKENSMIINHNQPDASSYEEIVESTNVSATYASFSNRQPSSMWGIEETRLFYKVSYLYGEVRVSCATLHMLYTFCPWHIYRY